MRSLREVVQVRGIIGPDPQEAGELNNLRGRIPQKSVIFRGAGAVLGFGAPAASLLAAACERPPAQVQQAPEQNLNLEQAMAVIAAATAEAESPSSSRPREIPGVEFVPYELKDRPYQIAYPKDWVVWSHTGSGLEGGFDKFTDPNSSRQEQLQRSISVFYTKALPGDTLDYLAQNLKELSVKHNKENGGTDFNPQQKPSNVAGHPAILTSYRYAQTFGVELETRMITFIAGGKVWDVTLSALPQEFEKTMPVFEEMLKQFKLAETAQVLPASSEITIRKSPEELYRALLTTSPEFSNLPSGFSTRGNSAGTPDKTAQAFKAIGQVNVSVSDNDPRFMGVPNGSISYIIHPSPSEAKGAYDAMTNRSDKRLLTDFGYPTAIYFQEIYGGSGTQICAVLVENILLVSLLTVVSATTDTEAKTIFLARKGLEHLKKIAS